MAIPTILLIEDDRLIAAKMEHALVGVGYQVTVAHDGQVGLNVGLQAHPDLVVLDLMLPTLDGWTVCQQLRERSTVPILMLTALDEEFDRIQGLEIGADDYVTKPFSMHELIARIKALLRRVELDIGKLPPTDQLKIRDIALDLNTRRVFKGDQLLKLRYKEFELLSLLMLNAGETVTRAEIFDRVWGTQWLGDMRTLDVHIRWLREKLNSADYIQTIRGTGYRFISS